ncbi:PTS sugar transporter subunit IIA [Cellulomonas shaoxiangyii]|uniref:PTS glucose transporter subunit IIA n=1 Tax=Cellulomonas shaoxiangyii TaxID=2566013 RepID=A0A4V1CMT5_9CELL|nr:PTS glucose transporter subunit IIA [Cellulomonas shaoxiangyii]QCB94065.1 PTS glucose transporter subunit IIA [Cellulomonas shaoxiangyii]TGY78510.1 PTS glucose transporter subunit IIA [Cellulomonas shaoxiangyii]
MTAVRLLSPVAGTVRPLADVPDPVFAGEMVGPGVAVQPDPVARQDVLAPCDGVVGALHPHAFALDLGADRAVLVHVGIDTVGLKGEGFEVHVEAGAHVRAGDRVLTWSPLDVAAAGLATVCPVVVLQGDPATLTHLVPDGARVDPGRPLLDWAPEG